MKNTANIMKITFILLIFYLTKDKNILSLTISFSMYMLYSGLFSTTSIKEIISKYNDDKDYNSRDKVFKYSILTLALIGVFLAILSYYIGNILSIDKINIINIFMTLSVMSNIILKIIKEYLEATNYKKISNTIIDLYSIVVLTIDIILSILLFKVFSLDDYINYSLLYSVNILVFIIFTITLYLLIFKKTNKHKSPKKEKLLNKMQTIIVTNKPLTIYNVTQTAYIYISIIILYYVLTNKYNYNYQIVDTLISNTYFYGLIVVYYIAVIIEKYLNVNYKNIKNNFNTTLNKIIKVSLNLTILLIIISKPLSNLFFDNNYNFLSSIIPLLFFYIIYNFIINININYTKESNTIVTLIIGLIAKVLFDLPLINTIYRMGYSLTLGSVLSSILGLTVSIVLGAIFIKNKFKLNLLNNFNNILNIIYESIIYTLVVVLFTLIIKVDTQTIISSILVITFYIFITILFHIIERILTKK